LGKLLNGKNMKIGQNALLILTGCAALTLAVRAADISPDGGSPSTDNPYIAITTRNIFDLQEATLLTNVPPEAPASPSIKLVGITTILGDKQALLTENEPVIAGKPATTHSLILREHERFGGLEVLEINPQARTVRIKSDEKESLIHLMSVETRK